MNKHFDCDIEFTTDDLNDILAGEYDLVQGPPNFETGELNLIKNESKVDDLTIDKLLILCSVK